MIAQPGNPSVALQGLLTGDVRAVAVPILAAFTTNKRHWAARTSTEFLVSGAKSCIDNIGRDTVAILATITVEYNIQRYERVQKAVTQQSFERLRLDKIVVLTRSKWYWRFKGRSV